MVSKTHLERRVLGLVLGLTNIHTLYFTHDNNTKTQFDIDSRHFSLSFFFNLFDCFTIQIKLKIFDSNPYKISQKPMKYI